jgi:hypothetical protein
MGHPSFRPDVQARRSLEFERAKTAHDVALLEKKWIDEDAAMIEAAERAEEARWAPRQAAPAPAPPQYPHSSVWSQLPPYRPLGTDNPELEEFHRDWHARSEPLPVIRPQDVAYEAATLADVRNVHRDALLHAEDLACLVSYSLAENVRLKRRVAELEARPMMKYMGVWVDGIVYEKGQLVTLGGSIWYCNERTVTRPTTHDGTWTLAVKAGRDGKSAR